MKQVKQTIYIHRDKFTDRSLRSLIAACGGNCQVIRNHKSTIVKGDKLRFIVSNSYIGIGALKLVSQLKSDIKINFESGRFDFPPDYTARFYKVDRSKLSDGGSISGVEHDIEKAYLNYARYYDIISDDMYSRLYTCSSSVRKFALGALGVKKNIITYENFQIVSQEVKRDEFYNSVWNLICWLVDRELELRSERLEKTFVFYWFDNYYSLVQEELRLPVPYRVRPFTMTSRLYKGWYHIRLTDGRIFYLPAGIRKEAVL